MRFVLVRHAQSHNNRLWAETGSVAARVPDPELTALGRRQADAVATAARRWDWRPTQVYASLMVRALQTAVPLGETLDLPVRAHPELYEVGGPFVESDGVRTPWPGSPRSVLQRLGGRIELPQEASEAGWYAGPYEAEADAAERAARVVAGLRAAHAPDDVVVLVTHGWFTQHLLRTLLGGTGIPTWFTVNNAAVSLVAEVDPRLPCPVEVRRLNDVGHLGPGEVTE